VTCLDERLRLGIAEGPNLICGDTPSDVPMIEAAISLMDGTAAKLAVLFVITPEQNQKTPQLFTKIRSLCATSGAQCAILPSPDVLVATLRQFARTVVSETATVVATGACL